jgi:glycosyltransferase involved in cell wall biosynthesis
LNVAFTAADLTVVIPAHDAATTIAEAIESIIVDHDPAPTVIVVDDRSTDATADIAARCGATMVTAEGTGPGAARNTGVRHVETGLLAFCDADDWWHDVRITEHLGVLADTTIDLVLGRTQYHVDAVTESAASDERGGAGNLLAGQHFDTDDQTVVIPHFGAATLRTEAFHRVGWIDETLSNYEDYEWFYRARDLGLSMLTSDQIAHRRRITTHSTSRLNPPTPANLMAVMQRSLQRRRALGQSGDLSPISQLGR